MSEQVNHPAHYGGADNPYEAIIEAWSLGFNLGNAVKYISRAGKKGDVLTDLRKAQWYLTREITKLEMEIDKAEAAARASEHQRVLATKSKRVPYPSREVVRAQPKRLHPRAAR